ncbi:MAG: ABC transporter permease [Myxococcota bacterium]
MRAIVAIARRETAAYFTTPIGWICLCAFVVITGFFFFAMLLAYSDASAQAAFSPYGDQINVDEWIVQPLFGNMGVIALLMSPALTMRLIAEDRRQRVMELLLTSPISSAEIVLGKFLGALGFGAVLAAATLHYAAILFWLGKPDVGIFTCNYVAFLLLLGTFFAVGLFASSLTENQIVALVVAFAFNLMIWVLGWVATGAGDGPLKAAIEGASMLTHVEQLGKGLLHVEDVVYFVTFIGFFLFATTQRVEALRWR